MAITTHMKPIQFNFSKSKEFYTELKTTVKDYFEQNNISDKGNWRLYWKTIILFIAWLGAYALILFVAKSLWAVIGSYILFWLIGWLIGFNVMHDGGHGWYSKHKRLNQMMWYSMNLLWSHLSFWQMQHNVLHHTYTNIDQYDDDIDSRPVFRFHPDQERKRFHKYQHLYFLPLYGLGIIAMMFYGDYKRYFTRQVGSIQVKKLSIWQHSLYGGHLLCSARSICRTTTSALRNVSYVLCYGSGAEYGIPTCSCPRKYADGIACEL